MFMPFIYFIFAHKEYFAGMLTCKNCISRTFLNEIV